MVEFRSSRMRRGIFPADSMGPKIQAIVEYLTGGGKQALITNPENIERVLKGETGTVIVS